ncbi:MAG: hypothetical protein KA764_06815, partial [Anaerolineales bacterium]|nr:hypothetical protein [Anaerolineales bacterium]
VRARGLAEAESQKAKAEALAAYDGVAQRVELVKLQLDAQIQIEIAKAQALGTALGSMNLKLIGDPQAAATLLKLVTLADGAGEVVRAAPASVRELGQQVVNKLTGSQGDALLKPEADPAALVPQLVQLVERHLDVNALAGQTLGQVLATLNAKAADADRPAMAQARAALQALPFLESLPFDELYLRAAAH